VTFCPGARNILLRPVRAGDRAAARLVRWCGQPVRRCLPCLFIDRLSALVVIISIWQHASSGGTCGLRLPISFLSACRGKPHITAPSITTAIYCSALLHGRDTSFPLPNPSTFPHLHPHTPGLLPACHLTYLPHTTFHTLHQHIPSYLLDAIVPAVDTRLLSHCAERACCLVFMWAVACIYCLSPSCTAITYPLYP